MWKFWKGKSASEKAAAGLSRADALACVPVPNAGVEVQPLSETIVRLHCPMVYAPWVRKVGKFMRSSAKPQVKTIELDELGTTCWRLLDGERTVQDVVDAFAEHYSLHQQEAHVSVIAFLRDLGNRGLIIMQSSD